MRESLNNVSADLTWKGKELEETNARLAVVEQRDEKRVTKAKNWVTEARWEAEEKVADARRLAMESFKALADFE